MQKRRSSSSCLRRCSRRIFPLLCLNLRATLFRLWEAIRVCCYYYRSWPFLCADSLLALSYLLRSPHRISRAFLKGKGVRHCYTYGETPLTTFDKIMQRSQVFSTDLVYEMGCGTGRTCFWLQALVGCRVCGIDHNPLFLARAARLARWLGFTRLSFRCVDFCRLDLQEATVVYLYGTALTRKKIEELLVTFSTLRKGTRVITISYPLSDYGEGYTLLADFPVRFPWGETSAYLQTKN